ncbi:DUF1192 domain-containing protein [Rhodoligotrophos defluvii]|uniref:DUF1192 domain-containing protein n=1 Tax=Rhodoligotrophos defluvii TaxID=2561934 RepID=UPI0010C984A3|nr:DUF1192 domain-containing protein [Rhodoligotrophos defluvii]
MAIEDEEVRRKSAEIRIGDALDALSVEDLTARITILETEISRIRNELRARQGTRAAAEQLFRK